METPASTSTPRRGGAPVDYISMSPSPSHTPRSSSAHKSATRLRGPLLYKNGSINAAQATPQQESSTPEAAVPASSKGPGGVNVQVLLRCRPLSEEECRINTPVVITCNDQRREVSVTQNIANKQIDRTFVFDKVFGPKSKQQDVFNHAVVPLVNEVLDGYNCTIFAYGQTGTGKTYTMEGGGGKAQNGDLPSDAGVIPRAVKRIFDILEAQSAEYSMKVSFLELYNEELTDLLAPEESKFSDDKSKKPMALMEDGKGGVFVRGLEEELVSSAAEIYRILDRGSAKRKTAETLLNKQSSRSHSIFSITIHIKECTPEGEEMIKCGKLNLVDLAGSENISRSGARDGRAREAGEINKSLLTLGRVINTLVEHSGHIPYRDSKLTRLLRDSLGGKTKTCIIATIAPTVHCLEETLSTLDYAHRAKHIKNKPEVNQKMMKSALIKDLYFEMDRLKQELFAAREKNGVYIPREQYLVDEAEKKAMAEKLDRLELDLESKDKQLDELQGLYESQKLLSADLSDKIQRLQKKMKETECTLADLEERYIQANDTIKEKQYLIENLLKSEKVLVDEAQTLRSELENTAGDLYGLFSKLERKEKIEDANRSIVQHFHSQLTQDMSLLHMTVSTSVNQQEGLLKSLEEEMKSFLTSKGKVAGGLQENVRKLKETFNSRIEELHGFANELNHKSQLSFENLNSQVITHTSGLEDCMKGLLVDADQLLIELQNGLSQQEMNFRTFIEQQHEDLSRNLERTKCVSATTMNFFRTIDSHALELKKVLEESEMAHQKQLFELQKKFEVIVADQLLIELQNGLSQQEMNFRTFIEQQHEDLSRNLERTKCVSATTMNFFRTIDSHALELKKVLEESEMAHQKQLFELQKKFEVIVADQLLIELQNGLSQQEMNFRTFIEQQHEDLSRNLERTKCVSATTMNFFRTIDSHALELKKVLEESEMAHQKQLFELQKKFEVIVADQLLIELQNGLSQQEMNFRTFIEQQHEDLSRNLERTKCVSATTMNFFRTIDSHALELKKVLEESEMAHQKQLFELQKKFEVIVADEEKYLMEKVAGLLAESNARKKNVVRDDICSLNRAASERSDNLQTETTKLHDFTSLMKEQWEAYMHRTEESFQQNVSSIEQKRCFLAENLEQCKTRVESCSEQWSTAQKSVLALGRDHAEATNSIISDGTEESNKLNARFSSAVMAGFEDNDVSIKYLLHSVDDSLKLDHGICENVKSITMTSRGGLHDLHQGHFEKTTVITGDANRSLGDDYTVDEVTCSTPRRHEIKVPSSQSIAELATPPLEDLVKTFWDNRAPTKLDLNGSGKQNLLGSTTPETQRAPLATIN